MFIVTEYAALKLYFPNINVSNWMEEGKCQEWVNGLSFEKLVYLLILFSKKLSW